MAADDKEEAAKDDINPTMTGDSGAPRRLEQDDNGRALIPDYNPNWSLAVVKEVVRSFFAVAYRKWSCPILEHRLSH